MSRDCWKASAQPIHPDGTIGFADRNPIEVVGDTPAEALSRLGDAVAEDPFEFDPDDYPAWDITLEGERTQP